MAKAFHKFIQQEEKGAKKKERIRQEKKQLRKETQEFFAKKKAERYQQRTQDGFDAQPGRGGRAGDERRPKGGAAGKTSAEGSWKGNKAARGKGRNGGDKGGKTATTDGRWKGNKGYNTAGGKGRAKSDRSRFDDNTRFDKEAKGRGSFEKKPAQKGRKANQLDEGKNWKSKKGFDEAKDHSQSAASFGKSRNFQSDRNTRNFQENTGDPKRANFHNKKDKGFKPSRIQTGKAGTDIGASFSKDQGELSHQREDTFQGNEASSRVKKTSSQEKADHAQKNTGANQSESNFSQQKRNFSRGNSNSSQEKRTFTQKGVGFSKANTPSPGRKEDSFQGKPASYKSKGAAAPGKQDKSNTGTGNNATSSGKEHKSNASANSNKENNTASASSMPLNKFIAHSGICSRRDAADMVKAGKVTVNGTPINEPGFKVTSKDQIKVNGKAIAVRRNLVYILLNKPKDYITTTEDPQGRKTVLDIIRHATAERVYPIGRLDRNTTGVLLLTNDGELAQKLAHPSYEIKKIYEVTLDKPLTKSDFETIANGIQLEDGFIAPDVLAYADAKDKSVIGIEIHSGRNRIVRRIFEAIGYDVRNLDRVMYANLTKKNVERGKWRFLTEKEVRLLKFLNASYTRNKPARRG